MNFQGGLSGAAQGASIGSMVPGIGTAVGAGIGGLMGLFGGDDPAPGPQTSQQIYHDLPDWLKGPSQDIASKVGNLASRGWTPLTGELPGASSLQTQAFGMAPDAAGTWQPYMQNASQNPLELMKQFYQDPSAAIAASHQNWEESVANPLARRYAQGMAGTGEGMSTQGLSAMGKGLGQAAAAQTANETQMQLDAQQKALQNANAYIGQQAGLGQQASNLNWGDTNNLAALGGQQRQIGTDQANWNLNLQNLNQNTGPLSYLSSATQVLNPMYSAMGSSSQFGTAAPPSTQTMNPMTAFGQGALGGLNMYNAFSNGNASGTADQSVSSSGIGNAQGIGGQQIQKNGPLNIQYSGGR